MKSKCVVSILLILILGCMFCGHAGGTIEIIVSESEPIELNMGFRQLSKLRRMMLHQEEWLLYGFSAADAAMPGDSVEDYLHRLNQLNIYYQNSEYLDNQTLKLSFCRDLLLYITGDPIEKATLHLTRYGDELCLPVDLRRTSACIAAGLFTEDDFALILQQKPEPCGSETELFAKAAVSCWGQLAGRQVQEDILFSNLLLLGGLCEGISIEQYKALIATLPFDFPELYEGSNHLGTFSSTQGISVEFNDEGVLLYAQFCYTVQNESPIYTDECRQAKCYYMPTLYIDINQTWLSQYFHSLDG